MDEVDNQMSFLAHLEELRWRIVKSVIAILVFAIVMWFFKEWIIQNIFISMTKPSFVSFRFMCEYLGICLEEIPIKFQSNKVGSQFSTALLMSFVGGFIIAFPIVFHQLWGFVKPGLKVNEKKEVSGITFFVSVLFLLGVVFGYLVVAPLCIQFFGIFSLSSEFENIWMIASFMSLIISSVIFTGLLFLLPIVVYILTKIGILNAPFLRKYRKHSIVGVLILSALITPPDFISQVIVSIPIIILYEVGILISARVERKRLKAEKRK
ncbi:twin-arginine translocase subunit TatC [Brumimicrobium glaciale]|jgi:sec-independent protein translocase protein TatC|uniref:Sec-independent protein translocase protein TatC n=1 Tax=Brumimicrobium glaciale TaxID=200475 RepID=A0A4Q4KTE4_9FLAO|nr:twin-arginine translocase subunit TatC [Brumimicrobium glaciale]RYM36009.1 twin-arginine translocase subunit TatC [Brumimicrobium glaciale]